MIQRIENKNAVYVFFILLTIYLSKFFYLNSLSAEDLMTIIPDDAFYYLQMVKMRELHGFWSFDGHNPATGFHLLYGYFLLSLAQFINIDHWQLLFEIVSLTSILLLSISGSLLYKTSFTLKHGIHNWLAPSVLITPIMINIPFLMMESSLVIFFAALSSFLIFKKSEIKTKEKTVLFTAGLLLSLSRSDAGLIIGSYFSASLLIFTFSRSENLKNITMKSLYALIGAITGIFLLFTHNLITSGEILQSSAQIKSHWTQVIGYDASPAFEMAKAVLLPLLKKSSPFAQLVMGSIALAYLLKKTLNKKTDKPFIISLYATLFTILAYIIFYGANSQSLQLWYTANFLAPSALFLSLLVSTFPQKSHKILTITFILFSTITTAKKYDDIIWPNQKQTYSSALKLKERIPKEAKVAAWNAGILGYISQVGIINIDGLANDSSTPYILENKLIDYLKKENILYIVDSKAMLTEPSLKLRGGYNIKEIHDCFDESNIQTYKDLTWLNSEMFIFKINYNCINLKQKQ